jgi:aconitase A
VTDPFAARGPLGAGLPDIYRLGVLADRLDLDRAPVTLKILLENALRHAGSGPVSAADVETLASWRPGRPAAAEIPFMPARVVLQDFTGVPAVVDLAVMRDAMAELGGDPAVVNPLVPADLVIDHSVQVDAFGTPAAFAFNVEREYERNGERYQLLRWAQTAFRGFRVVPPGTGIVHQVNLEHLATVVTDGPAPDGRGRVAYPDTLVGTDSHTTMINALGVLGYGVGGIEAEVVLLGQPLYQPMPRVVGVRLHGELPRGATATDLVLVVTQMLRAHGVVGAFVEFAGDGLASLALADRATISNMSPEFGATATLFPIDDETLAYLRLTGRPPERLALVERYAREQGLWREPGDGPDFDESLELDLSTVEPSLAGPRRPQDRVPLEAVRESFRDAYPKAGGRAVDVEVAGRSATLRSGSVAIAAITSCTNTSNPTVMVGAGLLARNAVARGLTVGPTVKTSLAPGSKAVTGYLHEAGLMEPLERLGFALAGYGCTTCIGNSGPLDAAVGEAIEQDELVVAAVLSGNRNFEGRIHPLVRASYLASPPLVVLRDARALLVLGDSVTTDHISPAGSIAAWSPAGSWLQERGVTPVEFNSYGARRGHHEVMVRGTFGNIRLRNRLVADREGPYTVHLPDGREGFVYDVAMSYADEGVPLVVLAGKEYGSGSSRDWAAKGTRLLGVRAVIAESFERIHRSNLVGMGVLPLQLPAGDTVESLGLSGRETLSIADLDAGLAPRANLTVVARRDDGTEQRFEVVARLDGPIEVEYYRNGGILPAVLRRLAAEGDA